MFKKNKESKTISEIYNKNVKLLNFLATKPNKRPINQKLNIPLINKRNISPIQIDQFNFTKQHFFHKNNSAGDLSSNQNDISNTKSDIFTRTMFNILPELKKSKIKPIKSIFKPLLLPSRIKAGYQFMRERILKNNSRIDNNVLNKRYTLQNILHLNKDRRTKKNPIIIKSRFNKILDFKNKYNKVCTFKEIVYKLDKDMEKKHRDFKRIVNREIARIKKNDPNDILHLWDNFDYD
jgi:hypothetical protein